MLSTLISVWFNGVWWKHKNLNFYSAIQQSKNYWFIYIYWHSDINCFFGLTVGKPVHSLLIPILRNVPHQTECNKQRSAMYEIVASVNEKDITHFLGL